MKLKEYQGKELFKKYGIPVPKGKLITSVEEAKGVKGIAKAQVLSGKRKKNGLIKEATEENIRELLKRCKEVLIEEKIKIEKEYYLALTIDRELKDIVVLFSDSGGIDVEENKNVIKLSYDEASKLDRKEFLPIIEKMYKLMKDYKALLVEINPLALCNGKLIAADSKIILDNNFKQSEFSEELSAEENEAKKFGFSYVELDGNIAIIGNGAGLVMATLDTVNYYGGKAANFLDLGGGADKERMEKALEIILRKEPKIIFINIFGGITRCDDIANGLVEIKEKIKIPIVVRMIGTNEDAAKDILKNAGIKTYSTMEECAKKAVENVNLNR